MYLPDTESRTYLRRHLYSFLSYPTRPPTYRPGLGGGPGEGLFSDFFLVLFTGRFENLVRIDRSIPRNVCVCVCVSWTSSEIKESGESLKCMHVFL